MVRRVLTAALAATAFATSAIAQKCSASSSCPEDSPCCSAYGDCGVGAFCLGGCYPLHSHSLEACVPNPVCKSGNFKLDSLDDVQSIDRYLGDSSKINWQSQGKPVVYQEDSVLLTMAEGTGATLLASTHYVWYGKVCATMTTSQGAGVVTAFILMSDVKDEIDFEWVGVDVENAQSNYYSQGVTVYTNGKNLTVGNTVEKMHEYCIDWKPDSLDWIVDGKKSRTVNRKDTWNSTANRFDYPQTPSRIMLSLWPAGLPTNEEGTIKWAGGVIDWNSPYMQNGFYYARIKEVTVECYDPPEGARVNGDKAYLYTDEAATNNTVEVIDKQVILGSMFATGEDPDEGASAANPTRTANTVPGGNPGGNREENSAEESAASGAGGAQPTSQTGFSQGGGGQGAGSQIQPGLAKVGGGAVAIVIAVLGLMVI